MNRRNLVKCAVGLSAFGLRGASTSQAENASALASAHRKTADLAKFEKMPLGVSFCFGMNTFTGNDYDEGTAPATVYAPSALNVDQWLETASLIGARYAILTAQHMSSFCPWDADNYDYDVATSGNRQDVCAAFVTACQKRHIMHGFY